MDVQSVTPVCVTVIGDWETGSFRTQKQLIRPEISEYHRRVVDYLNALAKKRRVRINLIPTEHNAAEFVMLWDLLLHEGPGVPERLKSVCDRLFPSLAVCTLQGIEQPNTVTDEVARLFKLPSNKLEIEDVKYYDPDGKNLSVEMELSFDDELAGRLTPGVQLSFNW